MNALVIRQYAAEPDRWLSYKVRDSQQTLAEALEEYYQANLGVVARPSSLPAESAVLFRSHDICHVIFGLDTTLADETIADTRTLLSTDVGWGKYLTYFNDPLARAVFKTLGLWRSLLVTIRTAPRIMRAIQETRNMKKKWPWLPPESFLDRTLADLRSEFGIRMI